MEQKRILTMQDLSCFGKCSLSESISILSALGHEAVALPTALLSTHTSEFEGYTFLDLAEESKKITDHWEKLGIKFDAVLVGYLGSVALIDRAEDIIKRFGKDAVVLVDPAMAENGELYSGFDMEYVEKMKELCALADFITPNHSEAELLGEVINCTVIETGLEYKGKLGIRCGEKTSYKPVISGQFYGAGDAFSSAFLGIYMKGYSVEEAMDLALEFVWGSVKATENEQEKYWYGTKFEQNLKFLTNL
ncbi:MAG: bifunctional hydroxymethylpyrimidine kinase/phosphomethylpyrimidine kinase [Clostridia bacterium]|nr:bifunctional hydroxymethylpyrimidine kinase/phosphomethylpyrimidine kinase [Clostridia bacterium]